MQLEAEHALVVTAVRPEADGVVSLRLEPPDGTPLPPWTAGAHVDVVLSDDLVRQYSLCGSVDDHAGWQVAVLREQQGRGGSAYVHERVRVGDTLAVRGPRNHFALAPAERYLFVAGGIGITPLLPMIAAADAAGADWHLVYGGRSRSSMAFTPLLEEYADRVLLVAQDEAGLPDLDGLLADPQPGTLVYCCGPEGLLSAVEQRCTAWPTGSLHLERFAPVAIDPDVVDTAFEVVLEQSGLTLSVPADGSVFDTVRAAGVRVLGSCLEGTCGTCETEVLDGEIEHRDSVLTPEEQASGETMMICVSRCRSPRLVLDL